MAFQLKCDGCDMLVSTDDTIVRYTVHDIPGTRRQLDLTNLTIVDGSLNPMLSTYDLCTGCSDKVTGLEHGVNVVS